MKMRKKLAALLAAAMIASMMPMTAFAASDNGVTKTVAYAKDTKLKGGIAPDLKIKLKDDLVTTQAFYLNLENAEWLGNDDLAGAFDGSTHTTGESKFTVGVGKYITGAGTGSLDATELEITRLGNKTLRVQAVGPANVSSTFAKGTEFILPIAVTLKGGEATVEVESADTVISTSKHVFATSSDSAKAKVTVASPSSFAEKGKIAKITLDESYISAFAKATSDADTSKREIKIELRDNDFEFVAAGSVDKLRGFDISGIGAATSAISGRDNDVLTITLPDTSRATQRGAFEIKDVEVRRVSRNAAKGEVKATISGELIDGTETIVLANHGDFSTKLADTAKETKEVFTGGQVDVEFKLSEEIANSLLGNRTVDFELSNGARFKTGTVKVDKVKDVEDTTTTINNQISVDKNNKTFSVGKFDTNPTKKAEYTFKATLLVPNSYEGEEVTLKASGKALSDEHEIVIAKVKERVSVEVTSMDVKVGLKSQIGGKIVIKENEKEAIKKSVKYVEVASNGNESESNEDAYLVVALADRDAGLKIKDADIEVTEGDLVLDLDDKFISDGTISIRIKRQSTKPSTVEITNIEVTADRTVPEGKYDIKVGGSSLSDNAFRYEFNERALKDDIYEYTATSGRKVVEFFDPVVATDFINITTKNTEDNTGATAAKVQFVIGASQYLVNGVEQTMDAAAYAKDGRTMVPVRYVAAALGITGDKVVWDGPNQAVTIIADKTIQVKLGSKMMLIDGVSVPMSAAAEAVSGRVFVPVAEIARGLGVTVAWDSATQTATFN